MWTVHIDISEMQKSPHWANTAKVPLTRGYAIFKSDLLVRGFGESMWTVHIVHMSTFSPPRRCLMLASMDRALRRSGPPLFTAPRPHTPWLHPTGRAPRHPSFAC